MNYNETQLREPCKRVGINCTKKCNWRCKTCFYFHNPTFNTDQNKSLPELKAEIDRAINRGCDHALFVGEGEPMLYPHIKEFVQYCTEKNIKSSIITNGTGPIAKYEKLYEMGLNHIHISVHGFGETLNDIAGAKNASKKQIKLLEWLRDNNKPFRTNTTIQQTNYKQLPEIVEKICSYNPFHVVLLGFLPHYEWSKPEKLKTVAVNPKELQPYLEKSIDTITKNNVYTTLRYHPFCHLKKDYWKFVTNARYVLFDPWEWEYEKLSSDHNKLLQESIKMGNSVANMGAPCNKCDAFDHCGGYNKTIINGFDGADIKAINEDKKPMGYYFYQNEINNIPGYI